MPVLSTIEVTLRDAEAEQRFLAAFGKASGQAGAVPGLLELKAFKLLGTERSYLAFTLWEDSASIEEWMRGHREQEFIRLGKEELLATATLRRFEQLGDGRSWRQEG